MMLAKQFDGYPGLEQVEIPKHQLVDDRVLIRVKAAGVTPLDHTILVGSHPRAKAPLVLGNEGAGVIEESAIAGLKVGDRVAFTGVYGVAESGAWQDYVLVRAGDLLPIPDQLDDVLAASMPVAYLTAQIALMQAGFASGKTVFTTAIGGSVGNATYQVARALGAEVVIATAGSSAKAARARDLGYHNVIDLSVESIPEAVWRITAGKGVDIAIESLGGTFIGAALGALASRGALVTIGYTAGREASIDVTDLIWKRASMSGFALVTQTPAVKVEAWNQIMKLLLEGKISPIVARTYPLKEAPEALHYLHEERPFGKVVLEL